MVTEKYADCWAVIGMLEILLELSGVQDLRPFYDFTRSIANPTTQDGVVEMISMARGLVLGIQFVREGIPANAPSPLQPVGKAL
jgi:hypothetical protein